jgi:hypothetical protein
MISKMNKAKGKSKYPAYDLQNRTRNTKRTSNILHCVKMPSQTSVPTPKTGVYRSFLVNLDKTFKKDDLYILKFTLKDVIPEGVLETLNRPLDVFSELEQRGYLGPDNLDKLRKYLGPVERPKLIEMVDEFEDADTEFPLKPRSENRLEEGGYSVSVKGGRHFDTSKGEFVEVRSGSNYGLTLANQNNHQCLFYVEIDGYEMFPNGFILCPRQNYTIERPLRVPKKFKFFEISDAPAGSGINRYREDKNGLIQVKFCSERADMKITCVASGSEAQTISCSTDILDTHFLKLVSNVFGNAAATVMITPCKPLGQRGVKLVDYGVRDGSRVNVSLGVTGGKDPLNTFPSNCSLNESCTITKRSMWKAGATTLEGDSDQEFGSGKRFPTDMSLAVILTLRLVARENQIPIPSTGNPTPLTKATRIPPPVQSYN